MLSKKLEKCIKKLIDAEKNTLSNESKRIAYGLMRVTLRANILNSLRTNISDFTIYNNKLYDLFTPDSPKNPNVAINEFKYFDTMSRNSQIILTEYCDTITTKKYRANQHKDVKVLQIYVHRLLIPIYFFLDSKRMDYEFKKEFDIILGRHGAADWEWNSSYNQYYNQIINGKDSAQLTSVANDFLLFIKNHNINTDI